MYVLDEAKPSYSFSEIEILIEENYYNEFILNFYHLTCRTLKVVLNTTGKIEKITPLLTILILLVILYLLKNLKYNAIIFIF